MVGWEISHCGHSFEAMFTFLSWVALVLVGHGRTVILFRRWRWCGVLTAAVFGDGMYWFLWFVV